MVSNTDEDGRLNYLEARCLLNGPDGDLKPNTCDYCGFPLDSGKYHDACSYEVAKLKLKGRWNNGI